MDDLPKVSGTVTTHFEDPALYRAYMKGQEDLIDFLLGLLKEADDAALPAD